MATAAAGTGTKVITKAVPIWLNEDVAASHTLVRQTDAVNISVTNNVKNKVAVFQIDPSLLDVANDFDYITVKTTASSQATNFACAEYIIEGLKYAQASPPTQIT